MWQFFAVALAFFVTVSGLSINFLLRPRRDLRSSWEALEAQHMTHSTVTGETLWFSLRRYRNLDRRIEGVDRLSLWVRVVGVAGMLLAIIGLPVHLFSEHPLMNQWVPNTLRLTIFVVVIGGLVAQVLLFWLAMKEALRDEPLVSMSPGPSPTPPDTSLPEKDA